MYILNFSGNINTSIQIGDLIYSTPVPQTVGTSISNSGTGSSGNATFSTPDTSGSSPYVLLGTVADINPSTSVTVGGSSVMGYSISVNEVTGQLPPQNGQFIFFAKNNEVNQSSVKGYYNNIKFENNSASKAELFAVTCNIINSSK
tara:strand:+ start:2546 stop:2983 length:438 start_codon:yes stop_codon:yes gene_type:complete